MTLTPFWFAGQYNARVITVLKFVAVALGMVIATCLVSTMALFMGGGQSGTDLQPLMVLQLLSVPAAILAIIATLLISKLQQGGKPNAAAIYAAVPQWMALAVFLLLLLVGSGEIAFLIVTRAANSPVAWTAHAPLMSMMACSIAICVIYACTGIWSGRPTPKSGRW